MSYSIQNFDECFKETEKIIDHVRELRNKRYLLNDLVELEHHIKQKDIDYNKKIDHFYDAWRKFLDTYRELNLSEIDGENIDTKDRDQLITPVKENLFVIIDSNQLIPTPENLNISTPYTSIPMDKTYYVIQSKVNGKWQDVLFSRGCNPDKKARHYRNKHEVETRVIRIVEHKVYTYEYALEETYKPNK